MDINQHLDSEKQPFIESISINNIKQVGCESEDQKQNSRQINKRNDKLKELTLNHDDKEN